MYAEHSFHRLKTDFARVSARRPRPFPEAAAMPARRAPSRVRLVRAALLAVAVAIVVGLIFARAAQGALTPPAQAVVVRPGDTLWSIAASHYPGSDPRDRVEDIEQLNHLSGPIVQAGTRLVLPAD